MDASKITQMRQKQANKYINRAQVVDSSTLTWQNQIQASKYVASQAPYADLPGCQVCGTFSTVNVGSGGVGPGAVQVNTDGGPPVYEITPGPRKPNPLFGGSGSASRVYSSANIAYMRAGQNACAAANPQSEYVCQTLLPEQQQTQLIQTLPTCFCSNQDIFYQDGNASQLYVPPGADVSGNWLNPYLPIPKPYIQLTQPSCGICGLYKVVPTGSGQSAQNNYETAIYVPGGPLLSTIQNGQVVYSTIAPVYDFIPNPNNIGGTLVPNGFTKPRATDPRSLP
jgi:hypothetical protein